MPSWPVPTTQQRRCPRLISWAKPTISPAEGKGSTLSLTQAGVLGDELQGVGVASAVAVPGVGVAVLIPDGAACLVEGDAHLADDDLPPNR
jgi:hypothetical protein